MKRSVVILLALASLAAAEDKRPWYVSTDGFQAPASGEHPRLLFRREALPALREKARTPEGKAILERLRLLLDGQKGNTLPRAYRPGKQADDEWTKTHLQSPGVYSIGHVAGYGLLYQLTGEERYAELGKHCFEKALEGVPDRDGRYGFRTPGGPLRAGPSVGWYAVGYDLCYHGWDAATREKFGRALAEYAEPSSSSRENITSTLEVLAMGSRYLGPNFRRQRGTHPGSNHFGMQVGGATLALLAVSGEPWVDQARIDKLLALAEKSTIRNLTEGFGDGGFFAEGDGTGSMSSQIAFVTALQAWKNAAGKDFINGPRPNARMLTLKWIYQTIVRDGAPDFWPVRGKYQQNVWSRRGLSGAGYFALGFGAVSSSDQSALRWYYDRFLAKSDTAQGQPYDTASWYPHLAVCSFINWPTDLPPRQPRDVLPHSYHDSKWSFFAWRNRWQDDNDTVMTVLLNRTEGFGGYLFSEPDRTFFLNSGRKHLQWGTAVTGKPKHWEVSPKSRTSSLTMSDGTALGVDFTGSSGVGVLLVTTGKAEGTTLKVGDQSVTVFVPGEEVPIISRQEHMLRIGKQTISLDENRIVFAVKD